MKRKQILDRIKNVKRYMKMLETKEHWSNMDFDLYESKEFELYALEQLLMTIRKEDEQCQF